MHWCARADLVRQDVLERVGRHARLLQLGPRLRRRLAAHQRLRLRQEVSQQDLKTQPGG